MNTDLLIARSLGDKSEPGDGKLQIQFRSGDLCIDVNDILNCLSFEQKREIAKYVCFDEVLQEALVGALVKGYVYDEGWYVGGETYNNMREKLLPLAPRAIRLLLENKIREANREKTFAGRWRDLCWKMQRIWNDRRHAAERMDDRIEYDSTYWPSKEQVTAMIAKVDADYAAQIAALEAPEQDDGRDWI